MKLSKRTLAILKNFASINQSIVINPGNVVETISNTKDMFGKAIVDETFEQKVAIYDLNQFLGVVGLFDDPDFEFGGEAVTISEGKSSQKYYYADPAVITQVPETGINLPSTEVTVALSRDDMSQLVRAASINNASDLTFSNEGTYVHDKAVPTSNRFSVDTGSSSNTYALSISVDKLKMVSDDYKVDVCAKGLARFEGAQGVIYFVALQPDGFFNG